MTRVTASASMPSVTLRLYNRAWVGEHGRRLPSTWYCNVKEILPRSHRQLWKKNFYLLMV